MHDDLHLYGISCGESNTIEWNHNGSVLSIGSKQNRKIYFLRIQGNYSGKIGKIGYPKDTVV